jgi:hypothetical protein
VIPTIICLVATELVTTFIWNFMIFISCLTLIHVFYPAISGDLPNEMISSCHFISFGNKMMMSNEPLLFSAISSTITHKHPKKYTIWHTTLATRVADVEPVRNDTLRTRSFLGAAMRRMLRRPY